MHIEITFQPIAEGGGPDSPRWHAEVLLHIGRGEDAALRTSERPAEDVQGSEHEDVEELDPPD